MNPILEAIRDRRSVRRYKPDMVPQAAIDEVIQAGLWAASGRGLQAPIVVAMTNRDLRDRLSTNCHGSHRSPVVVAAQPYGPPIQNSRVQG